MVEKEYRVPVDQMDLCDGSIGQHWSEYRQIQNWAGQVGEYIHQIEDYGVGFPTSLLGIPSFSLSRFRL